MNHVKKFTVLSWERDWIKYSDPNYSTWPIFFLLQFFYLGLDSNMKYFELLKLSRVSLRVSQKNSLFHVLTIILCSVGYSDSTDYDSDSTDWWGEFQYESKSFQS